MPDPREVAERIVGRAVENFAKFIRPDMELPDYWRRQLTVEVQNALTTATADLRNEVEWLRLVLKIIPVAFEQLATTIRQGASLEGAIKSVERRWPVGIEWDGDGVPMWNAEAEAQMKAALEAALKPPAAQAAGEGE